VAVLGRLGRRIDRQRILSEDTCTSETYQPI